MHLAKSFNNAKNKYIKTKLNQNNNLNNKNKQIRLSPVIKTKNMKLALNNSQNKLFANKINTKKIKIQDNKNDNTMENIKPDNLFLNKSVKI